MIPISRGELREWLGARADVQHTVGRLHFLLARWNRVTSRPQMALHHGLEAWRWLGSEAIGSRRDEIREWVFKAGLGCGELHPIAQNPLRRGFLETDAANAIVQWGRRLPPPNRVRMRRHDGEDPRLPGNLIILKRPEGGEKGVILLKYTPAIKAAAALFDVPAMAQKYSFVLEPSSWGYQDAIYLMYAGRDIEVVVQSPAPEDFDFLSELQSNLHPVRIGAGDWVDPALFTPCREKSYDLIAVSGWNPLKRHRDLFAALSAIRRRYGQQLRVALVGYNQGWTRKEIVQLMGRYGLRDTCELHEGIPYTQVATLLAQSRAYVLMSRREGANKAMYESLFSDVPIIVYRQHRGINPTHVNRHTGVLYAERGLADAIMEVMNDPERFSPRKWAEEHTGCYKATTEVGGALRELASESGMRWKREMVSKTNAPNLRYVLPSDVGRFAEAYDDLLQYLRP